MAVSSRKFAIGNCQLAIVNSAFAFFLCASVFIPFSQAQTFDNTALAWTLPWDADWVTAVTFIGLNRLAAGNNLGDILVWNLPEKTGGPAPLPFCKLAWHSST